MTNNNYKNGFFTRLKAEGPFKSKKGLLFGVCKGLSEYYGWSISLVRLVIILIAIFTAFWPMVILYLIAATVMVHKPKKMFATKEEEDFWLQSHISNSVTVQQLAQRRNNLEKRLQNLESHITSKTFSWDKRFNEYDK